MRRKAREQEFFKKQNKYAKGGSKNPLHNTRNTCSYTDMQDVSKLGAKPSCTNKAFIKIQLFSIQRARIVSGLNYIEAQEHGQNPDHHQSTDNGQR